MDFFKWMFVHYLLSSARVSVMFLQRFSKASSLNGSSFRNFTASTSTRSTTRILLWSVGNWSGQTNTHMNEYEQNYILKSLLILLVSLSFWLFLHSLLSFVNVSPSLRSSWLFCSTSCSVTKRWFSPAPVFISSTERSRSLEPQYSTFRILAQFIVLFVALEAVLFLVMF